MSVMSVIMHAPPNTVRSLPVIYHPISSRPTRRVVRYVFKYGNYRPMCSSENVIILARRVSVSKVLRAVDMPIFIHFSTVYKGIPNTD